MLENLEQIIEAVLFTAGEPVSIERLQQLLVGAMGATETAEITKIIEVTATSELIGAKEVAATSELIGAKEVAATSELIGAKEVAATSELIGAPKKSQQQVN